jgi:hypothetical protein
LDTLGNNYTIVNTTHNLNTQQTLANWSVMRDFFMFATDQKTTFIIPGQPLRVKLPSELFFGDLTGITLQMDFEDGLGFRNITPGSTFLINYNSGGSKHFKARLLNADGVVMTNQNAVAQVNVGLMRLGPPDQIIVNSSAGCGILNSITAGAGAAFIKYSRYNNGKMLKPYIIVEGIEMESFVKGNSTLVNGDYQGFGMLSWKEISSGEYGPSNEHLEGLTDFVDSLDGKGYDVVFVDFITNRASIQSNAKVLASIISQINSQLIANGSTEHIEIVGASMGGLIARVALREMELSGCCHNVKLYTTFSTPHLGANVPLAFQEGLKDMLQRSNFLNLLEEMRVQYDLVLNSPAARQMLINHVDPNASFERASFSNYLQQLGHPREARKNAVTNGSIVGEIQRTSFDLSSPYLTPGSQLFLFASEAWVPTTFPIPFNQRTYRNAGTNGMYLMRSEGFVLPYSPNSASNQLYYKGGKSLPLNLADVIAQYITYSVAAYKFVVKTIAITSAAIATPPAAPVIIAVGALKLTAFSHGITSTLQSSFQNNLSSNQSGIVTKHATFVTFGLDYAPGDYSGLTKESKVSFLSTRRYSQLHTFVPTVSSLDLQLGYFTNLISINTHIADVFAGFEGVISGHLGPDAVAYNSKHVNIHPYLLSQVYTSQNASKSSAILSNRIATVNTVIGKPLTPRVLTKTLNSDVEIYNWTIANNAKLSVNAYAGLNYAYAGPGVPLNTTTRPNSHFITKTTTYDCDSVHVNVQGGGTFELGEITPGNRMTAEVYFRKASTLTLHPGATLRINNFSTLILEEGSSLIVHPGANIVLEGDSAVLEIKGNVILLDQAVFGFTGGGFVRINQGSANDQTGSWTMGQNSRVQLLGQNRNDLLAEVIGEWLIHSAHGNVKMVNGRVFMRQNARMNFSVGIELYQMHLTGDLNARHGGLVLHGQPNVSINRMEVENATVGITAYLLTFQNALTINESVFNRNLTGLETHGRAVSLLNSTGSFNGTFWRAYDIEGVSRVRDCRITQNFKGIDVMGQHGARLDIISSVIDSNNTAVFSFGNMQLKAYCSSFSSNVTGFYSGNTHVLIGGKAQNRFRNNDVAIYLEEVDNLYIYKGNNDFTGSNWYITGMFSGIANNYLQVLPNVTGYFLNIKENKMPLVSQALPIDLLDYNGNPVLPHDWTFVTAYPAACVRTNTAAFDAHLISTLVSTLSVVSNGQIMPVSDALSDALSLVSADEVVISPSDLVALSRFDNIFSSLRGQNPVSYNAAERVVLEIGLERMLEALSNSYRFNLLQAARADKFFPLANELNWVVNELNYRISHANLFGQNQLEVMMKLAHAYRTGEYYDKAIVTLNQILDFAASNSDLRIQAEYWLCVCKAEAELIGGEITSLEFEQRRAPCLLLIPEMRRPGRTWNPFEIQQPLQDAPEIVLYPNPALGAVRLKQTADNGPARVTVINMDGKMLKSLDWPSAYDELILDRDALPAGIYVVKVEFENSKVSRVRWTIL